MYHAISVEPDPYTVSPVAFRRQIEVIHNEYEVIRLSGIDQALREDGDGRRKVAITFDDAYCDFEEHAFPALEERGMPCTVFVPSAYIGGFNEWDAGEGFPRRKIMNISQLQRLRKTGLVEFGSHTVDHLRMSRLSSAEEMRRQALESRFTLEAILDEPVTMFAYPYGQLDDFSRLTTQCLIDAGYRIAVTTHWGTRNTLHNVLSLRRISFMTHDSDKTICDKVEGAYDWISWKEKLGFLYRVTLLRKFTNL